MYGSQFLQPCPAGSRQCPDDYRLSVSAPRLTDTGKHRLCLRGHIHLVILSVAVSTVIAGSRHLFSEIGKNIISKAGSGLAITFHDLEPSGISLSDQFDILRRDLRKVLVFQQELIDHNIPGREQQNALRRFSISPGTSGLLIVILHALGHIVVDDISDVGFIDAHTKSIRGHDHRKSVIDKVLLAFLSGLRVHSRMVFYYRNPSLPQKFIHFVHIFPCGTIDDSTLLRVVFYIFHNKIVFLPDVLDPIIQVLPVKSRHHELRILQAQHTDNNLLDFFRSRGRKCTENRPALQSVHKINDLQIAGAEILSPLGNTMRLIHRDHGNLCLCDKLPKLPCFQSLRRHIDNLVDTLCRIIQCLGNLRFRKRGIDICRPDSCRIQCFHLILHQ